MNYELFTAKKYLFSKKKFNFITIISILSTVGISIGVAALIVVLSVFNGFGGIVKDILINFDPHIRVTFLKKDTNLQSNFESKLKTITSIKSYNKFIEGKSIVFKNGKYYAINLKGTDTKSNSDFGYQNKIVSGNASYSEDNRIVIGTPLALRLEVMPNDTINLTSFIDLGKAAINLSLPNSANFVITGIFESFNREYDLMYAFTSLETAQEFLKSPDYFTGYEIRATSINSAAKIKESLEENFSKDDIKIESWFDLHKDLYTMMTVERFAAFTILALIIMVATFNILASLTMSVIQKKRDIGILRSMGAKEKSIQKIFMYQGILIGVIGTILGLLLGLIVCFIQVTFKVYPLDPQKYIIDAMPISISIWDIIAICSFSIFLSFIASLYPAKRALKTSIVQAIKWE